MQKLMLAIGESLEHHRFIDALLGELDELETHNPFVRGERRHGFVDVITVRM